MHETIQIQGVFVMAVKLPRLIQPVPFIENNVDISDAIITAAGLREITTGGFVVICEFKSVILHLM